MGSTCALLLAFDVVSRPPIKDRELAAAASLTLPDELQVLDEVCPPLLPSFLHSIIPPDYNNPSFYPASEFNSFFYFFSLLEVERRLLFLIIFIVFKVHVLSTIRPRSVLPFN